MESFHLSHPLIDGEDLAIDSQAQSSFSRQSPACRSPGSPARRQEREDWNLGLASRMLEAARGAESKSPGVS
jgi:hypothetical protein